MTRILEAGNSAPSGENCQPWRFAVSGDVIEVWNRPERDQSAYNWGQRGSYVAIGAAIENIVLAAGAEGFNSKIAYFPGAEDHVATITLSPGGAHDKLADVIAQRVTNRKPYRKEPLAPELRQSLLAASQTAQDPELRLIEDPEDIAVLGRAGSTNEEIMLANKALHGFFFSHINWTKAQDNQNTSGFYIKTLELPPPAVFIFKVLRSWQRAKVLCRIGINRLIAAGNGSTNASASAIGIIATPGTAPLDFVQTGRTFERFWLAATLNGLSVQPIMGMLFFRLLIEDPSSEIFSDAERVLIKKAYSEVQAISGIQDKQIIAMFRVGHSEPPSARSSRFPLESTLS